jgi:hypothetical protein
MIFEMSLEELVQINRSASVGKLINGLIHNLNGSLQNMGMDMDMMKYALSDDVKNPVELIGNINDRLTRMEEEFDNLNNLLQQTSMRANLDQEDNSYLGLDEFLNLELSFLRANLYFKHHVRAELELHEGAPSVSDLPEGFALALSWLVQGLVEQIEKQKLGHLQIKTLQDGEEIKIVFVLKQGNLSENFLRMLGDKSGQKQHPIKITAENAGIIPSMLMITSQGASIAVESNTHQTSITVTAPFEKE